MGDLSGGLKTSAWTNFQPDSSRSSAFSSSDKTRLYRTMSLCKLRTMIMATMTVRNSIIHREVDVPARRPLDVRRAPEDVVREDDRTGLHVLLRGDGLVDHRSGLVTRRQGRSLTRPVPFGIIGKFMFDRKRLHVETHDARTVI